MEYLLSKKVEFDNLDYKKLYNLFTNEFKTSNCNDLVIDEDDMYISWRVKGKKKHLKVYESYILTNTRKRVTTLLSRIYELKSPIAYTENTNSDASPITIELPSFELYKFDSVVDHYNIMCKRLNYISPWIPNVISQYIEMPGVWLLQGESGTGKTTFINLLAAKWGVNRIISFTGKYNIADKLSEVSKYRYNNPDKRILIVFEEFDRALQSETTKLTDKDINDKVIAYVKSRLGVAPPGYSFTDMFIEETTNAALEKIKSNTSPVPFRVDLANNNLSKSFIEMAAAFHYLQLHKSDSAEKSEFDINKFLNFIEAVHQFSLSMLKSYVVFTTNSLLLPSVNNQDDMKKLTTSLRIGRCNILQYKYLNESTLKLTITNKYPDITPGVISKLVTELMKYEFNKQYKLILFFKMFPTATDKDYNDIVEQMRELHMMTTLDEFNNDTTSKSRETTTIQYGLLSDVID